MLSSLSAAALVFRFSGQIVEAEKKVLANVITQPEQSPERKKVNKEEPSWFL